ncbi:MAG: class I SAM-dependent methyltransferase [Rickettsiaceae bacterium]|nr:class I SAM-dependent methyltransferase [Rickettsiaceae bacterium]
MSTNKITKLNINDEKDIKAVVEHYLDYPYPMRNPEDEKFRMLEIGGEHLDELNHWLYRGKEKFDNKFRVLVAGGGTGDASTYLGEQLKDKNAEIIYLDFSAKSMEIAKKRAEIRGLKNIRFINDSIFNIPKLKLGKFDYINCSGVLHHLSSPSEGLLILKNSLKPDGGMGLMVYAKYGRTAIYQMQELMRMINEGVTSRAEEVDNAKKILASLPTTSWYSRSQDLISDVQNYGDIGIYDLFLHKQDRCYSIPELYDFVEEAGLHFVEFSEVVPRINIKLEGYIKDPILFEKIVNFPLKKKRAIAEIMAGNIIKHTFYVSNVKDSVASNLDFENIPVFLHIKGVAEYVKNYLRENTHQEGQMINFMVKTIWVPQGVNISIPLSDLSLPLFENLDQKPHKTIGEIFDNIKSVRPKASKEDILSEINKILNVFIETGILVLKHKSLVKSTKENSIEDNKFALANA